MKMHNDNGLLYRGLYEKDPTYGKRRIFIPTTGLNNIERPIEDIIAERIEEAIDDVIDRVKDTAAEIAKAVDKIEAEAYRRLEEDIPEEKGSLMDKIGEMARKAIDRLLDK
jgi:hypothetical protein